MTTVVNQSLRYIHHKANVTIVIWGLWSVILFAVSFLFYLGFTSYHRASERLRDQTVTYAHLIAAHDRYGFTLADALLQGIIDHLTWNDFNGVMAHERRQDVLKLLRQYRDRFPGIASFTVIGADGIRRIGVAGKDFTTLSHRGYFKALRDGQESFISNAEEGLASGKSGIHVARRFSGPDGSFGGVVVINLAVQDVFYAFYKSLSVDQNFEASLRDVNGILIQFPKQDAAQHHDAAEGIIGRLLATHRDHDVLVLKGQTDGVEKLTAFERLEGTNIFASASIPVREAMAGPRRLAWGSALAGIASVLGGMAATLIMARTRAMADARDVAIKADREKRKLIQKVTSIIEDERKSIANEIHDELNATLISARLESQRIYALALQSAPTPDIEEIKERARSIDKIAGDLYARGRALVKRLRPEILDALGLDGAVAEMVQHYDMTHSDCRFAVRSDGDFSALEGGLAIAAYRLVQEALSNVVKHAFASRVAVSLIIHYKKNSLEIEIADNGVGFNPDSITPGIGLIGMRERVLSFNGDIQILSRTKGMRHGTVIKAKFPLQLMQGESASRMSMQAV